MSESPFGDASLTEPLGSIIIPAHNEAAVIERSLAALFTGVQPRELDVVIVCNGCSDDTARRARESGYPVRVLELAEGSKPAALRAGDLAALTYPRVYLDADITLHGESARQLLTRLRAGAVAARPPIRYETEHCTLPVRSYYRARSRVPAVLGSLWGAGTYGLSEEGRRRFGEFPDMVGDDLFVDRHFARQEIEVLDCAPVGVAAPRRTRDLLKVLTRTYRGNQEQQPVADAPPLPRTIGPTLRDLGRLLTSSPTAVFDVATYAAFALTGRLALSRAPAGAVRWERDESSRV